MAGLGTGPAHLIVAFLDDLELELRIALEHAVADQAILRRSMRIMTDFAGPPAIWTGGSGGVGHMYPVQVHAVQHDSISGILTEPGAVRIDRAVHHPFVMTLEAKFVGIGCRIVAVDVTGVVRYRKLLAQKAVELTRMGRVAFRTFGGDHVHAHAFFNLLFDVRNDAFGGLHFAVVAGKADIFGFLRKHFREAG